MEFDRGNLPEFVFVYYNRANKGREKGHILRREDTGGNILCKACRMAAGGHEMSAKRL